MSNPTSQRTVVVSNENGLHLVPCSQIARVAGEYECEIRIRKESIDVDAKTVLELITLNAGQGTTLELLATGEGADEAVDRLVAMFESDFEVGETPERATGPS